MGGLTLDKLCLLEDKVLVWRRAAEWGPLDLRDYNRRAADAMEAALRELKAAAPFFAIANAVTDVGDPDYREWFAEAGDHCVAFCFAGSVITLGDLRAAARAQYPERDIPAPATPETPENAPSGKA